MEDTHGASLLGLDIGSLTVSIVQMDLKGRISNSAYLFHKGQIRECLREAGRQFDLAAVRQIAVCSAPYFNPEYVSKVNPQLAAIRGTRHYATRQGPCCWLALRNFS